MRWPWRDPNPNPNPESVEERRSGYDRRRPVKKTWVQKYGALAAYVILSAACFFGFWQIHQVGNQLEETQENLTEAVQIICTRQAVGIPRSNQVVDTLEALSNLLQYALKLPPERPPTPDEEVFLDLLRQLADEAAELPKLSPPQSCSLSDIRSGNIN